MVSKEEIKDELELMVAMLHDDDCNYNNADSTTRMRVQDKESIKADIKAFVLEEW